MKKVLVCVLLLAIAGTSAFAMDFTKPAGPMANGGLAFGIDIPIGYSRFIVGNYGSAQSSTVNEGLGVFVDYYMPFFPALAVGAYADFIMHPTFWLLLDCAIDFGARVSYHFDLGLEQSIGAPLDLYVVIPVGMAYNMGLWGNNQMDFRVGGMIGVQYYMGNLGIFLEAGYVAGIPLAKDDEYGYSVSSTFAKVGLTIGL
jgi:hypothetical protein